jgi:hypothetical protein
MQTSRVILANEPRLLRGMLQRVIARIPGLEVVGEAEDPTKLQSLINQTEAEWVITSIWPEGFLPSAVRSLVEHSSLCILGLAANGSQAKIVCADSLEETREGLSLDDLIAILQRRG